MRFCSGLKMKTHIQIEIVIITMSVLMCHVFVEQAEAKAQESLPSFFNSKIFSDPNLAKDSNCFAKKTRVKIATIGPQWFRADVNSEPQKVVEKAIQFWIGQLSQVLPDHPDLIVIPEACDQPVDWPIAKILDYYKVRKDQVQSFFAETAKTNNCYIVYPAYRQMEDGTFRNSCVLIDRKGNVAGVYNKNNLVISEHTFGTLYGKDAPVFNCDFGRVAFVICFDLNFDELRNEYVNSQPDLLIFCSQYHGGLAQAFWAYTCQAYFVGSVWESPSTILNPQGEIVASSSNYYDFVVSTINLDFCVVHLGGNREHLDALKSKYGNKVQITAPNYLGTVIVSSEDVNTPVQKMIREFNIETAKDYFKRSLAERHKPGYMEK